MNRAVRTFITRSRPASGRLRREFGAHCGASGFCSAPVRALLDAPNSRPLLSILRTRKSHTPWDTQRVHLCYIDDSGDSRHGVILTALIIHESDWAENLESWLQGRREIHREFGVPKTRELHANKLYKGRGSFCEKPDQDHRFGDKQREAVGRIMLSHLSRAPSTVISIGATDRSSSNVYVKFVTLLEGWAAAADTRLMLFYDGQQGLIDDGSPEQQKEAWDRAIRAAAPYREAHRQLDLTTRRIVEDVIMQDSRYSQFIQAADLLAYGAFHKHLQGHPEIWGTDHAAKASKAAIRAYMRMRNHWLPEHTDGILWQN